MTTFDESFLHRLRQTFNIEAEEHIREISSILLELEKQPREEEYQELVERVFRETHSLKGAARSINLMDVESLCQVMENLFSRMKQPGYSISSPVYDLLHQAVDTIERYIFDPEKMDGPFTILRLVQKLEEASKGNFTTGETPAVKQDQPKESLQPKTPKGKPAKSNPTKKKTRQQPTAGEKSVTPADDDEAFFTELRETFIIDAEEHLNAISNGLLALEENPPEDQRQEIIETIFREAHSLKGGAASVKLNTIAGICQKIETIFSGMRKTQMNLPGNLFDLLHNAVDLISRLTISGDDQASPPPEAEISELLAGLENVLAAPPNAGSSPSSPTPAAPPGKSTSDKTAAIKTPSANGKSHTIRIPTHRLDQLLFKTEDILASKLMASQQNEDLKTLLFEAEHWKKEWEKVRQDIYKIQKELQKTEPTSARNLSPMTLERFFKFLEENERYLYDFRKHLQILVKSSDQNLRHLSGRVDNLLDDAKKLLMLPVATLTQLFPKLVRDVSRSLGKEVDLVVAGKEVEIDKRILEEMKDPLIHILRNCLDHGIELPEERERLNKPRRGIINLSVVQKDAGKVEIHIRDDGAGIDPQRVKSSAMAKGIISPAEAKEMNDQESLYLIFRSQVSTSKIITDLSGRGLGMSIVREKVENLGGYLTIESQKGKGTTLRIVLPLTLARFRGILVEAGGQQFIIPTNHVERVIRVHPDQIKTIENRATITVDTQPISIIDLAKVLSLPGKDSQISAKEMLPVLILGSGEQLVAFSCREILQEQEVVVKSLGKQLQRVRNVSGATVLGSGKVALILNVADLIKSARKKTAVFQEGQEVHSKFQRPKSYSVLIAEDSITSRSLLRHILESGGYQVTTAVDGAEALDMLKQGQFDLLVTDVEMPRLDGFSLTSKIRHHPELSELPVVLVTSLGSPEHKERGIESGANAYIVKDNFDQTNLLETVERLLP